MFTDLAGPEGLTKHDSTYTMRDVIRAVAARMPEGADVAAIEDLADAFVFASRAVEVGIVKGSRAWTTQELLDTERRVINGVIGRVGERTGVADRAAVGAALDTRPTISDEQADVVADLCLSGNGADVVVGAAGTGKTFALAAAREAWERSGFAVHGAALAARAAAELGEGSGIGSVTLARLLAGVETGRVCLDDQSVVVVDEAGLVGTRTLHRLHRATKVASAKLVLVGDPEQLPEIEAGGAFRALTERLDAIRLTENRRQIEPWERWALDALRSGRVGDAVAAYDDRQRIVVVDDPDSLRQAVVEDWFESHRAGEQALMVAAHRSEVRDLNERARKPLDADGCLGPTRLVVGRQEFAAGDRVMAVGRNHYDLDILNGDLGTIEHIDSDTLSVTFRCDRDGELRTVPADRIEAGHIDHGYARTNHKAQGATVDRTFILGDDGDLDRQAAYTALSRGRLENRLYVVAPDADSAGFEPDARRRSESAVERELTRDRSRRLADELLLHLPPGLETHPPRDVDHDLDIGLG